MTEDELLTGILDACMVGGWMTHHIRRSDLAQQMGHGGWPDIFAVHPERREVFVVELKTQHGRLMPLQAAWLDALQACGIDAHVLRPDKYDATVEWLLGDKLLRRGR
jgi:hypothetical protein